MSNSTGGRVPDAGDIRWQDYEELVKDIYEALGQANGVTIECWGRSCKVDGPPGVFHQIDVLTTHSDGLHQYRTAISCKNWNKKAGIPIVRDCQWRRHVGPLGRSKTVPRGVFMFSEKSELTGQHKCPHHLLREMACLRVGQQRTGRKVSATLEPVALAVHLQDVDVVGEAVQQGPGEPLRPEDLGPLVEGKVGGHQD